MLFETAGMSEKEGFMCCLFPLNAENYFTWSHDMEVVLCDRGLWKFVKPRVRSENADERERDGIELTKADETKRDILLAYIFTSVGNSCKGIVRQIGCPREAWVTLHKTFQTVREAAIDATLSNWQALTLRKGEHIVEYSNRLMKLIRELKGALVIRSW